MTRAIDLSLRHFTRDHGDILVIGSWIAIEGRQRPCLILIRTGDENSEHCVPCVVTVDSAYIWDDQIGDIADARKAARQAFSFLQALRLNEHDFKNVIRIAMIVQENLHDLLHIPPYTPRKSEVVAELVVTDQRTGKTKEVEIRDDV